MTMPRQAAGFRPLPQAQKNVCAAGNGRTDAERTVWCKKRSRCRQVPRRRSGVSDLSAPACAGGLHSDPLAGICTPFRLSAQHADGTVCRYLICGFLPIIKYHIMLGFARWRGEKCGEKAARPSQPPAATALPEGEPRGFIGGKGGRRLMVFYRFAGAVSLFLLLLQKKKWQKENEPEGISISPQTPLNRPRKPLRFSWIFPAGIGRYAPRISFSAFPLASPGGRAKGLPREVIFSAKQPMSGGTWAARG